MGPGNARLFCGFLNRELFLIGTWKSSAFLRISQMGVFDKRDQEILGFSVDFSIGRPLSVGTWKSSAFLRISQLGVLLIRSWKSSAFLWIS